MSIWARRPVEPGSEWAAMGVANAQRGLAERAMERRRAAGEQEPPQGGSYLRTRPQFRDGVAGENHPGL